MKNSLDDNIYTISFDDDGNGLTSARYFHALPEEKITIPLEEYKELLIIKGKYEELKSQRIDTIPINKTTITYTGADGKSTSLTPPYKVTC